MRKPGKIPGTLLGIGLLAVCAGLNESLWRPWLHPFIFNDAGNYHIRGVMGLASRAVSFLEDLMSCGELWGTILAILAMPGSCALLPEPYRFWRYTLTLNGAGLLFMGISIVSSLEFFYISPGAVIRPMVWAAQQLVLLMAGLAMAATFGFKCVNTTAPRWLRWLGVLLCLAPMPVGALMKHEAMEKNGLITGE
jgi:hypothetical protein